jgi:hypothetical protein
MEDASARRRAIKKEQETSASERWRVKGRGARVSQRRRNRHRVE